MIKQFFVGADDNAVATPVVSELKEIDFVDLADVSGGIGTVTVATPTP